MGRMRYGMRKGMRMAGVYCGKVSRRSICDQPVTAIMTVSTRKQMCTTIQLRSCQRFGSLS